MKERIIYQLFLRPFTPEGTLSAATEKLPHIASLGINTVYLTSCCKADDDSNEEYFSPRQKASKTGNHKNPYRISDYYKLDEEYGTHEDLKFFVKSAHALGMEVLFDLVFLHCGPNPVFLEDHPDFVKRDENGNVICNAWRFPEINFESKALRHYLTDNMLYWINEFDFDGFRCDVGDQIPLDFWADAIAESKKAKPSLYMLNEGVKPEYADGIFNSNYNFLWTQAIQTVIREQNPASFLRKTDEDCRRTYQDHPYIALRAFETHDYANDHYENRPDKILPTKAVDCAHLINALLDGIPFIYNGNEIADGNRHSIWGNRYFGQFCIDWSKAETSDGKERLKFIKDAISLRKNNPWLFDAKTTWLDNSAPHSCATFLRQYGENSLLLIANLRGNDVEVTVPRSGLNDQCKAVFSRDAAHQISENSLKVKLSAYGFSVIKQ